MAAAATIRQGAVELPRGGRLSYAETGDPAGAPVLYFHGVPGSRIDVELFDRAAAAAGARVVAPDRPGFGDSTHAPAGYRLLDWPADAVALADELAIDRFAVLGFSSGGKYALACAREIPDRLTNVGAIGCVGPPGSPGFARGYDIASRLVLRLSSREPRIASGIVALAAGIGRASPRAATELASLALSGADRRLLRDPDFREHAMRTSLEAVRHGGAGVVSDSTIESRPWGFDLGEIVMPVHLWAGEGDATVPIEQAEYLARALPTAQLTVYAGHGHLLVHHYDEIVATLAAGGEGG